MQGRIGARHSPLPAATLRRARKAELGSRPSRGLAAAPGSPLGTAAQQRRSPLHGLLEFSPHAAREVVPHVHEAVPDLQVWGGPGQGGEGEGRGGQLAATSATGAGDTRPAQTRVSNRGRTCQLWWARPHAKGVKGRGGGGGRAYGAPTAAPRARPAPCPPAPPLGSLPRSRRQRAGPHPSSCRWC
jgi:hypothetical protein